MTLTNQTKLVASQYQIAVAEAAAAEIGTGAAESLALTEAFSELGDLVYSATAEGRTGEVAGNEGFDLDGEPGLIYSGPTQAAYRVALTALVVDEGSGGAEATDNLVAALYINNDAFQYADEGFVSHAGASFNFDTYVPMVDGDVLRVVLQTAADSEADADYDVTPANVVIA